MQIRDIEAALFQFGRLSQSQARVQFPLLRQKLLEAATPHPTATVLTRPNAIYTAQRLFDLIRNLREEFLEPELTKEVRVLIATFQGVESADRI